MAQHSLVFRVRRQEPELVAPAKPTPRELKPLSDLDCQEGLRLTIPTLLIYRNNPSAKGKDPAKVIREAIARALVFYYPLAGRLRVGPGRKLSVDCTGEGVLFIEADADVALDDFGPVLQPPFPCVEELLFDVPGSSGVIGCPLLLIQVTRFKYSGFIFALRILHTMSDASGKGQFINAVAEMARGATIPSISPSWNREFFNARDPPRVTHSYSHPRFGRGDTSPKHLEDLTEKSFFFGESQVSALRGSVPRHLGRRCSTFDLLTACLWRCRTAALRFGPDEEVHVLFVVSARARRFDPPVPPGYYGNAVVTTAASSTAGRLRCEPLEYALLLVKKAKERVHEEYVRSCVDQIVMDGPVPILPEGRRCFFVTDVTRAGFGDVDVGWGPSAYDGPTVSAMGPTERLSTNYTSHKNHRGEEGIVAAVCLPGAAMQIFEDELHNMLRGKESRFNMKSSL